MIKKTLAITLALCFILTTILHAQPTTQTTSPTFGSFEYAHPDPDAFFERVLYRRADRLRVQMEFRDLYLGMTPIEWDEIPWDDEGWAFRQSLIARFNETHANTTYEEMLLQLIHNSHEMWLPNRRLTEEEREAWIDHYWYHGGPTEHEKEIVRLINEIRRENRLQPVVWCNNLGMAARFYTQQQTQLGLVREERTLGHNFGPYATNPNASHGASREVARVFGNVLVGWNAGNSAMRQITAQNTVRGWMNSAGHRRFILSPGVRFVGVGSFRSDIPGSINFDYLFMNSNSGS